MCYTSNLTTTDNGESCFSFTGCANLPTTNNSLLSLYNPTLVKYGLNSE